MSEATQQETQRVELSFSYTLELWMYGIAFCVGLPAFIFTIVRLARSRSSRQHLVLAARLFSYKISLTVADCIVLFIYAPTQFAWIHSYWWFGGDIGCRLFKFISTFGFHLTANMQVLVAADRLLITAKMNRVTRNIKKRQYNTRLSLAAAWILALICAGPQLILFRQKTTPQGYPQCISIWTEHRVDFYDRLELLEQWAYMQQELAAKSPVYFYENGTLKYPEDEFPEPPGFTLEELHTNNRNWLYLERLYNVLHLATICVAPYALELICYTLILYILKGAAKGRFVTLSDIIKDIFCCCKRMRNHESPLESNVTQESDNLMVRVPSRTKRLQNIAPEGKSCDLERRRAASVDVPMRMKNSSSLTVCVDENGSATAAKRTETSQPAPEQQPVPPLGWRQRVWNCILDVFHNGSEGSVNFTGNKTELRFPKRKMTKSEVRRQSAPASARSNTMWVVTVDTARRNARWKAFIMLSLNLFFWAPYCILAITSSVIISQYLTNFQFVNALVTFNAVSNIIL